MERLYRSRQELLGACGDPKALQTDRPSITVCLQNAQHTRAVERSLTKRLDQTVPVHLRRLSIVRTIDGNQHDVWEGCGKFLLQTVRSAHPQVMAQVKDRSHVVAVDLARDAYSITKLLRPKSSVMIDSDLDPVPFGHV